MYLNKVFLIGNLTRDPQMKATPSGTSVTEFSVATNRTWKGNDGQRKEDTQYHNIVVWGRQAETVSQYLHKGDTAMVEGRLETRSWEKDGKKNYRTEIIADRVQFGPKKGSGGEGFSANSPSPAKKTAPAGKQEEKLDTIEYPEEEIDPDDIPF